MKKLSKIQQEIEGLAWKVPALTSEQTGWAVSRYGYDIALRSSSRKVRCPHCHTEIKVDGWNKTSCPHCGAKINAVNVWDGYRRRFVHQEQFFQIMNVVGGWQVTRLIYMQQYCYVKKDNTPWEFFEVCQAWNRPDCDKTYFRAYPKCGIMCKYRYNPYALWVWELEQSKNDEDGLTWYKAQDNMLEPRKAGGDNYFSTNNIAPRAQILPQYKKMGVTIRTIRAFASKRNAMWLFESLSGKNYKPMYETMLKYGETKLFDMIADYRNRAHANAIFTAMRIAKRHGYDFNRAGLEEWVDTICMLDSLGMDYHSPHYVCPDDLNAMHQQVLRRKRAREEGERLQREIEKNKDFTKRIAKYLDMDIHNEELVVIVLPNIKAFKDEGDSLGHCVYSMGYYRNAQSLILSARGISDGKRWETIEVDLRDFKIKQCYGYGDKFTEKHKQILNLVNKNMYQIRQRATMAS